MPTEHVCESYALQPISSTSPVPDDGAMLLAAVTAVLDRTDRVALLERTRAEIHGLTITELCDAKGWQRGGFYRRTDTAAERVAVEHIAGTDDGAMLLAAVTAVLDRTDRVALLERTRAEIHGLTITELCDAKGWQRGGFYRRTDTAAERVAAYLNVRATVAKREPMPEYGCSATRK